MFDSSKLGPLVSTHGTSPLFLQRAAIVAAVSLLFFITTMLLFYLQQSIAYFVLSTAFLVVYILTMIGWVLQKRNAVLIYEKGISYRKFVAAWDDLKSVRSENASGITLTRADGEVVTIGRSVSDVDKIAAAIRRHLP